MRTAAPAKKRKSPLRKTKKPMPVKLYKSSVAKSKDKKSTEALFLSLAAVEASLAGAKAKPRYFEHALKLLNRHKLPKIAEWLGSNAVASNIISPAICLRIANSILAQNNKSTALKWLDHGLTLNPTLRQRELMTKFRQRVETSKR